MTRQRLLSGTWLSICLVSAGCASGTNPSVTAAAAPAVGDSLRASVEWSGIRPGHVTVRVDRPAYVALFEIAPGFGVSLVHPLSADAERLPAGEIHVPTDQVLQRGLYESDPLPMKTRPLRIFFLVASTRPLDLAPFTATSSGPRAALGHALYASRRPREVMAALGRRLLPPDAPPAARVTAAVDQRRVQWRPLDATELP